MLNTELIFFIFDFILIPSTVLIGAVIILKIASHFHTNPYNENPNAKLVKVKELNSYFEQIKKEKIQKEIEIVCRNYDLDENKQKQFFNQRMNGETFNTTIAKLEIPRKRKQMVNPAIQEGIQNRIKTVF